MTRAKSEGIPAPIGDEPSVPVLVEGPRVRTHDTLQAFAAAEQAKLEAAARRIAGEMLGPVVARLDRIEDFRSKVVLIVVSAVVAWVLRGAV